MNIFLGIIYNIGQFGIGGYIYLSENHWYSFSVGVGQGSNNFHELSSHSLLLRLAVEHGAMNIQIFGDSQIAINRMTRHYKKHCVKLTQLKDEVHKLIAILGNVETKNIY